MTTTDLSCTLPITRDGGKLFIHVPWDRADRCRAYLKSQGIGSTLHFEPRTREARLEPWTNLSAERLGDLLAAWPGARRR